MKAVWLAETARGKRHPRVRVHVCFIVVFLFSSLLTWREALVLKNAYQESQRQQLEAVGATLDRQWQYSLDSLLFYRAMLRYALSSPIASDINQQALAAFADVRQRAFWQLSADNHRGLPINGVGDRAVAASPLLDRRDPRRLRDEFIAALEFSAILRLNDPAHDLQSRTWYLSRAGFFVSATPPGSLQEAEKSFRAMISRPYFQAMNYAGNPRRDRLWSGLYCGALDEGPTLTVSIPVDYAGYWYGVLAMDFSRQRLHQLLQSAVNGDSESQLALLDSQLNTVAVSGQQPRRRDGYLSSPELQQLRQAIGAQSAGQLRLGSRYLSWTRLHNFDGVLISIQSLRQGLLGSYGRLTLVLFGMWILFSLVLLLSHQTIVRMVNRMVQLQSDLHHRAWYDGLTRLYNRTAFFDVARRAAAQAERLQQPVALLQIDLDHFKSINDRFGHPAGDLALAQAAGLLNQALREGDIAGRVGGEEFCIFLPNTTLAEAAQIAERLRARLARKEVLIASDRSLKVTASFGAAASDECGAYLPATLQSIADKRLYLAKQQGRNRVCSAD
ncbi:cellulose biosynthesis regulator diguanylate cyclase DgcQ [Pantoea sp. 1.19]|uniref:cellulose biosynthesis regulator diguanylate cyclase DgcQ n=1 Tax=Pantoea sp. 1.19 TaxID=1925589 RepID=UPI00094904EC|nr:cellulose biosynthesis regulator diguanylate cyclase DgcQ [Pantoea sp. 1.19]